MSSAGLLVLLQLGQLGSIESHATLQAIAQEVEPEIRKIHNALIDDLAPDRREPLEHVILAVVAEDKYTPLDVFNAYSTSSRIVVSAGLWRRLNFVAFSVAHDQLYGTSYVLECVQSLFHPTTDAEPKWWKAYGEAVDALDERRAFWDKVAGLEEAFLLAVIAHEQAHIYLGHTRTSPGIVERRNNELEADRAAVEALYRIDPSGEHVLPALAPLSILLTGFLLSEAENGEQATREMLRNSSHPHPIERMRVVVRFFDDVEQRHGRALSPTAASGLADFKRAIRLFDESDLVKP